MKSLTGTIHRSDFPYVSVIEKDVIEVRLQTPKGIVSEVIIGYNDPYNYDGLNWIELTKAMTKLVSDDLYDWWVVKLKVDTRRYQYHFKIHQFDCDQVVYLTEAGLAQEWEVLYQFNLPYSHQSEIFTSPKWASSAIWYQIFPDRFATNGDDSHWHDGSVTNKEIYGGNIQGIISKLDYLKELGINSIYFTPIFKAGSSHKYDTIDYFAIDPQFGTDEDFQQLIDRAHELGIKIMLDGVFNHSSSKHPFFLDVMANKQDSKYVDWYHIRDFDKLDQVYKEDFRKLKAYDSFAYTEYMPKLNTQNPEVIKYIFEAVTKWTKMGIDGWRLDVANEVDHNFWKLFKSHVTAINPDIYIVGEIWRDAYTWLRGDEFHAVMNYKYTNAIIDYFFKSKISLEQFISRTNRTMMENITAVNKAAFNVFDSHDTMRISNMCDFDTNKQMLGTVFLFTALGNPCIYYGTEVGLTGAQDPDNRRLMPWDDSKWDKQLLDFYKQLIAVRTNHPVLANEGQFEFIDGDVCKVRRYTDEEEYLIIINNESQGYEYVAQNQLLAANYDDNVVAPGGFVIDKVK